MYNSRNPQVASQARAGRGLFISLEGIDGSGKSTHIPALVNFLEARGRQIVSLREPGGSLIGEEIRKVLLNKQHAAMSEKSELLLFAAARAQLVDEIIRPALEAGKWVICDRFMDSTTAYQGYGRGIDLGLIDRLNEIAVGNCKPDLTLLFDLPASLAASRLTDRKEKIDRIDLESQVFMEKTREGYLQLAAKEAGRFRLLDAALTRDEVERQIINIFREGTDL